MSETTRRGAGSDLASPASARAVQTGSSAVATPQTATPSRRIPVHSTRRRKTLRVVHLSVTRAIRAGGQSSTPTRSGSGAGTASSGAGGSRRRRRHRTTPAAPSNPSAISTRIQGNTQVVALPWAETPGAVTATSRAHFEERFDPAVLVHNVQSAARRKLGQLVRRRRASPSETGFDCRTFRWRQQLVARVADVEREGEIDGSADGTDEASVRGKVDVLHPQRGCNGPSTRA